jgi:hypothetical protein
MLTSATYRNIVLGSAIYDLLVTAPFATPWSFAFAHTQLDALNQSLGGAARLLFSTWMAWALTATGAPLLWLFIVPEMAWGVIQWWPAAPPSTAPCQ